MSPQRQGRRLLPLSRFATAPLAPLQPSNSSRQGSLFTDDFPVPDDGVGYRGPVACAAAGITYRQLDYWARTGLVEPTVRAGRRVGLATPLRVPRHLGFEGRQAAARHRRLAAEHPGRRPALARARHRRSRADHPYERRCERLRVHVRRRGHRPRPGRPRRVRHCGRSGRPRGRRIARGPAKRASRRRRWWRSRLLCGAGRARPPPRAPNRLAAPQAGRACANVEPPTTPRGRVLTLPA